MGSDSTGQGRRRARVQASAVCCGSVSRTTVGRPRLASAQPRLTASVLLPTPPFRLPIAMTLPFVLISSLRANGRRGGPFAQYHLGGTIVNVKCTKHAGCYRP